MSLILEALKKSEQQRQREKAPSLQSIHQAASIPPKKSTQPWWLIAVFIVVCNFAFFGYWFWQQQRNTVPVQAAQTAAPAQSSFPENNPAQTPPIQQSTQEAQPEFTQISPRATTAQPAVSDVSQRVYEINELPDNVRNNLPAMTFSFHVYSENPEQRTIIINDRRVREGEEVKPGLRLQVITQDGVILLFEQHRIHISVLSDW